MKAVILAGGLGTRLRPLTENRPKPLVPILNRPILAWVLDRVPSRVSEVIVTASYKSDMIADWVESADLELPTRVIDEGEPKSTGGALKNLEDELAGERTLVFNGDILDNLNLDAFIAFHKGNGPVASISLKKVSDPSHYGVVDMDGDRIEEFVEKPDPDEAPSNLINAGTYILEPEVIDEIPSGKVHLESEVFPDLLDHEDGVYGFPLEGYWIDCGRPANLIRANHMLMEREPAAVKGDPPLNPPAIVGTGGDFHNKATIGPFVTVGDEVQIGAGAKLRESIVLDGAHVGNGVRMNRTIVGEGAVIEDDVELDEGAVVADDEIVKSDRPREEE